MPLVVVALGSNLGDRLAAMQRALDELSCAIRFCGASSVYETAPMYVLDQPAFFNAAALGETELGPFALLDLLKQTERSIGRGEASRNAPREIDLDLIMYGRLQLTSRRGRRTLRVPHPQTPERRFVLAPLADLDAKMELPGLGIVDELMKATNAQAQDVKKLDDAFLSIRGDR